MLRLATHIYPLWDKEQFNLELIVNNKGNCCVRARSVLL